MKKIRLSIWIISLSIVLCFSGFAYAGGDPQDPLDCSSPPDPTSGPFIWGNFTVSQVQIGFDSRSVVHITLRRYGEVHLYNFPGTLKDLCNLDEIILLGDVAEWACEFGVGQDFEIDGFPVVKRLRIRQMELCGDPEDEMIRGTVLIRVVPLP